MRAKGCVREGETEVVEEREKREFVVKPVGGDQALFCTFSSVLSGRSARTCYWPNWWSTSTLSHRQRSLRWHFFDRNIKITIKIFHCPGGNRFRIISTVVLCVIDTSLDTTTPCVVVRIIPPRLQDEHVYKPTYRTIKRLRILRVRDVNVMATFVGDLLMRQVVLCLVCI